MTLLVRVTASVRLSIIYVFQYDLEDSSRRVSFSTAGLLLVGLVIGWEIFLVLKYALIMWKLSSEAPSSSWDSRRGSRRGWRT